MKVMTVRPMRAGELAEVVAMTHSLWPTSDEYDFGDESVLVWERDGGGLGGFISFSLRPWAEGCDSTPVPYIEGWWVAPDLRRAGVGRALVAAVEQWCLQHGHHELGSDVELDNEVSLRAHAALGFEPTLRLQFFRKRLR
jgi:aminoglycoside 6'-N-acetyltransferase I